MAAPDPFAHLARRAEAIGVPLGEAGAEILRRHYGLVLAANRRTNLTRITDPAEAVGKLYLGSLALFPGLRELGLEVPEDARYLDLGTGAGFPGIPVAVARPDLRTTLVDSRGRKAGFLRGAVRELGLARVTVVKGRGRELAHRDPGLAGAFLLVTSRAVGSVAGVVREAAALLAPGGWLVLYKGPELSEEEIRKGDGVAARAGLHRVGIARPRIEDLSPRLVVLARRDPARSPTPRRPGRGLAEPPGGR